MEFEEVLRRIEDNSYKIETNLEKINKNSYALEILGDYKMESNRLFEITKKLYTIIYILLGIIVVLCVVTGLLFYYK